MALTPRQQRFVEEYLLDLNATQAAIRAGYSKHTAEAAGSRLLRIVKIRDAIQTAQAERSKKSALTHEYILKRLRREANRTSEGSSHGARVKALELLGKHLGMFVDKIAPTDPSGTKEYSGGLTDEERAARVVAIIEAARARRA